MWGFDLLGIAALILAALIVGLVLGVLCLAEHMDKNAPDLFAEYLRRIAATRRCRHGRL